MAVAFGIWARFPGLAAGADGVHVLTYHNDNERSGWNRSETTLTPKTVAGVNFGKVAMIPVDGDVYAQPLHVSGVEAMGKVRNLLLVATQHDSVYAFDADEYTQVWHRDLVPGGSPVPSADIRVPRPGSTGFDVFGDISTEVGVTGTPVIRLRPGTPVGGTIYVVAKKKAVTPPNVEYTQELHALDLATGQERPKSPVIIRASVEGTGTGRDDGHPEAGVDQSGGRVVFTPLLQGQRAGLLLSGNTVYACWASHGDFMPYHGWIIGYDADSLDQVAVFNTTPNGGRSGVWMGAAAPAADAEGNIYVTTGNGTFDGGKPGDLDADGRPGLGDYGTSVLQLRPDPASTREKQGGNRNGWGLKVAGYFTPYNQAQMGGPDKDSDLGSGGVVLLDRATTAPRRLLATAGKEGVIYLIDRDAMRDFRFKPSTVPPKQEDVYQRLPADLNGVPPTGEVFGMPAWGWSRLFIAGAPSHKATVNGQLGEIADKQVPLQGFRLVGGRLDPAAEATRAAFGWKAGTPVLSGPDLERGIVWIVRAEDWMPTRPATLHAFAASDLSWELYNSEMRGRCDQPGIGIKFAIPTVANGKVYLGTSKQVAVYGLLGR